MRGTAVADLLRERWPRLQILDHSRLSDWNVARICLQCRVGSWRLLAMKPGQDQTCSINGRPRVCAVEPDNADDDHQQPLSVPRVPWHF